MAIRTEAYELNGRQFIHTWSDANRYVVGGYPEASYTEANDPAEFGRTYVEGDIIQDDIGPNISTAEDYENVSTLTTVFQNGINYVKG